MKVSSTWIQKHLRRTISAEQIAAALDQAGIEIEQLIVSKEIDSNIVVCLVKKVVQHPAADRLNIVEIDTNSGSYSVVCGAPNVREGIKVPYAQIGAVLPSGDKIAKVKLRGEPSEGMLCSERELGLGTSHEGLLELPETAVIGAPLHELYPSDTVIDLKTPANRFDIQSIWGLAREVAAITGNELLETGALELNLKSNPSVIASTTEAKPHLFAHVKLSQLADTPEWMSARLRSGGMRPISPLVDITNYVMLEYGQPLHAFDAGKLKLPVEARLARPGETLETLDGTKLKLTKEDMVIADANGPIGLAGVMGSAASEVDATTTEIWLEAAIFDAVTVRKAAKRHGFRTEASARYERGLPPELAELGMAQALRVFGECHKVEVLEQVIANRQTPVIPAIYLDLVHTSKILGFSLDTDEISIILKRLGIEVVGKTDEALELRVPWWRPDVMLPIDVIEEIVRVVGYGRVPSTIPAWRPTQLQFDVSRSKRRLIRDSLFAAGLFEVMTYSFVSKAQLEEVGLNTQAHLKLKNPLSVEQEFLRSSLLASHLTVAERNRTYGKRFGMYELSNVFLARDAPELPEEPARLAVTIVREADALAFTKGILDVLVRELNVNLIVKPTENSNFAMGRVGVIELDGRNVGTIGQLEPMFAKRRKLTGEIAYFELDTSPLFAYARPKVFAGMRRFPVITRDISVMVPVATTWSDIHEVLTGFEVQYVREYAGTQLPSGMRSLTLRLTVGLDDRTPTEAEARDVESKVLRILERKLDLKEIA